MDNFRNQEPFAKQGLYDPRFEHDNCGIGSVVNINGIKSRQVVDNALSIVETLEHRAGKDAEGIPVLKSRRKSSMICWQG